MLSLRFFRERGDVVPLAWQENEADQIAERIYDDAIFVVRPPRDLPMA